MANVQPITINGYSLDSSASVMASATTHDSAPMTDISMVKISRRDGAKITNAQYAEKKITITGQLLLNNQNDFEQIADDFKRNTEVQSGALNIPYASGTRQYNVWTSGVTVSRDSENIEYAPYQIDYIAADPPFGTDITNQTFYSASNITTNPWSSSVYFGGSAEPKPVINIGVSSGSYLTSLQLNTFSPPTQMTFSDSQFTTGNQYQFDTKTYSLTKNGQPLDYSGQWPKFTPNTWNGVSITTAATQGLNIDQQQTIIQSFIGRVGTATSFDYVAQTFTPSITANRTQVDVAMKTGGAIAGGTGDQDVPITITLQTVANNIPSGSVLATAVIPAGTIKNVNNITTVSATFGSPVTLTAGTKYAYVINSPYSPTTNFIIYGSVNGVYGGGNVLVSYTATSGSFSWNNIINADIYFRDWYTSGNGAQNLNISFSGTNRWL